MVMVTKKGGPSMSHYNNDFFMSQCRDEAMNGDYDDDYGEEAVEEDDEEDQ